jgi:hypothetical protein
MISSKTWFNFTPSIQFPSIIYQIYIYGQSIGEREGIAHTNEFKIFGPAGTVGLFKDKDWTSQHEPPKVPIYALTVSVSQAAGHPV